MKKKFVEPEIVRIDLKMTENIANSEQYGTEGFGTLGFAVYTRQYIEQCHEYYVGTMIKPSGHEYIDTNQLVMAIAQGGCFTNPADQARALMMYAK